MQRNPTSPVEEVDTNERSTINYIWIKNIRIYSSHAGTHSAKVAGLMKCTYPPKCMSIRFLSSILRIGHWIGQWPGLPSCALDPTELASLCGRRGRSPVYLGEFPGWTFAPRKSLWRFFGISYACAYKNLIDNLRVISLVASLVTRWYYLYYVPPHSARISLAVLAPGLWPPI